MEDWKVTQYASPLGKLTLASDGEHLTGLWLEGQKYFGSPGRRMQAGEVPVFLVARQWLDAYFTGEPEMPMPSLAPEGSPFRQAVWGILRAIPWGEVTTYGAIAQAMTEDTGRPVSARAVGGAVGHNPISILIPCHRVVGTDGSLTGYAGGVEKKRWLLQHEGADLGVGFHRRRLRDI